MIRQLVLKSKTFTTHIRFDVVENEPDVHDPAEEI